jgi:hypothetical protein
MKNIITVVFVAIFVITAANAEAFVKEKTFSSETVEVNGHETITTKIDYKFEDGISEEKEKIVIDNPCSVRTITYKTGSDGIKKLTGDKTKEKKNGNCGGYSAYPAGRRGGGNPLEQFLRGVVREIERR